MTLEIFKRLFQANPSRQLRNLGRRCTSIQVSRRSTAQLELAQLPVILQVSESVWKNLVGLGITVRNVHWPLLARPNLAGGYTTFLPRNVKMAEFGWGGGACSDAGDVSD